MEPVWFKREVDTALPLHRCFELKINRGEKGSYTEEARFLSRWRLCVFVAFIGVFRPFHCGHKSIRTCNITPQQTHGRLLSGLFVFSGSRWLRRATESWRFGSGFDKSSGKSEWIWPTKQPTNSSAGEETLYLRKCGGTCFISGVLNLWYHVKEKAEDDSQPKLF